MRSASHPKVLHDARRCLTLPGVRLPKDDSLTIRIPAALKSAVERVAEAERRTVSQMVELILEQYLEERDEWPPAGERKPKPSGGAARRR